MVLTTPLFAALKRIYPATRLTVLAAQDNTLIPSTHPAVDEVIGVPRGLTKLPVLMTRLRGRRFDLYIDPKHQASSTSRIVADMVRAERRIVAPANAGRKLPTQPLPAPAPPGHYVDVMLAPATMLAPGVSFARRPSIAIPPEAFMAVDPQVDPGERGFVAVNVSAGSPTRYWEPAKWRALIDEIARTHNVGVISSPADREFVDEICSMRKRAHSIRTESILEAAAAVARSIAVVTPDTSIVHLAAAVDRPVVGLYPPIDWNATLFAPLSTVSRVLMPAEGEPLAMIPVADVLGALRQVLRR